MRPTAPSRIDDPLEGLSRGARSRRQVASPSANSWIVIGFVVLPGAREQAGKFLRSSKRSAELFQHFIRTAAEFVTLRAVLTSAVIVVVLPPLTFTCPAQVF